jgi:fatty acid amide hydrolase
VVDAFIQRLEQLHAQLNALVVQRFAAARREADIADARRSRGSDLGPLHGVPVTVKECFLLEGTATTLGVVTATRQPSSCDGPLVQRLRSAGAIVLGKSNVSQLMFFHETDNPVYGCTTNPWNVQRTPGGSSGGEAALVAAGCSPLGLGNDLGGSIRIPCHFCGIAGFKPTALRLTRAGSAGNLRGMEALIVQPGPMSRDVCDLQLAMSVLGNVDPLYPDPDAAPAASALTTTVSWDELRVG